MDGSLPQLPQQEISPFYFTSAYDRLQWLEPSIIMMRPDYSDAALEELKTDPGTNRFDKSTTAYSFFAFFITNSG